MRSLLPLFLLQCIYLHYCAILYVSPNGSDLADCTDELNPCLSIERALFNVAESDDEIHLSSGVYKGDGNTNLIWGDVDLLNNIQIKGSESGETIIDGELNNFFLFVPSCGRPGNETHIPVISISHVTFINAQCSTLFPNTTLPLALSEQFNTTDEFNNTVLVETEEVFIGGSILFAYAGCQVEFSDCIIKENGCGYFNTTTFEGSGIISVRDSSLTLTRVEFKDNKIETLREGGVVLVVDSHLVLEGCVFISNAVEGEGVIKGEGIVDAKIEHCRFYNGSADDGAALNIISDLEGETYVVVRDCTFEKNTAEDHGGSIVIENADRIVIEYSTFSDCVAGGNGGAMEIDNSDNIVIQHCLFQRNDATTFGGAFRLDDSNNTLLHNITFLENLAYVGGGPYISDQANLVFQNSTFLRNVARLRTVGIAFGGGAYIETDRGEHTIRYLHFEDNEARSGAGLRTDVGFEFCTFIGNKGTANGGGVSIQSSNATITDSIFIDNRAEIAGGIRLIGENITVSRCHFELNSQHAVSGDAPANLYDNTFLFSAPYDVEGFLPEGNLGNSFQRIAIPPIGDWITTELLEVSELSASSGSLTIHSESRIIVSGLFEYSVEGIINGHGDKSDNSENDPILEDVSDMADIAEIVLTNTSTSNLNLGALGFTNITIDNSGKFNLFAGTHTVFSPVNTRIIHRNGAIFNLGSSITLKGNNSEIFIDDATFTATGQVYIDMPMVFSNRSTIVISVGDTFMTWLGEVPEFGHIQVLMPAAVLVKVGDRFRLLQFNNETVFKGASSVTVYLANGNTLPATVSSENGFVDIEIVEKQRTERFLSRWGDASTIVTLILLGIGLLATLIIEVIIIREWNTSQILRASTREFLVVILAGIAFMYIGALAWVAPVSDILCELKVWLPLLGFITALAPLIAKTYRIKNIFDTSSVATTTTSFQDLIRITVVMIGVQLIILILWSSLSHNHLALVPDPADDDFVLAKCTSRYGSVFLILTVVYEGIVLIVGAYFAFAVRKVPTLYNESKWMGAAIYNNLIWATLLLAFGFSIDSGASSLRTIAIVVSLGIWFGASVTLVVMFVPKLWMMFSTEDGLSSATSLAPRSRSKHSSKENSQNVSVNVDQNMQMSAENQELKEELEQLKAELEDLRAKELKTESNSNS